jgi:hypothetical protein
MHLEHADSRLDQLIRDEEDILKPQGDTGQLAPFAKG